MNQAKIISKKQKSGGFTLVELLVVIFIIGILATLLITNFQGIRQRARDSAKKSEVVNLKTALRIYYNDYQSYPPDSAPRGYQLMACGDDGASQCPIEDCDGDFTAGGIDGCQTTYMKDLTESGSTWIFKYYNCSDDDFRLKVTLENLSDEEIAVSQARCPYDNCGAGVLNYFDGDYVVCGD